MLKNIVHTFFTRIFAAVANLAVAIIISNVYGASIKGEQGLILTTITLISLLTAIVGSGSVTYFTPRIKTSRLIAPSYLWNALVCMLVFILLKHTSLLPERFILHTVLLAFLLTATHIHTGLLLGIERISQSNLAFLLNTIGVLIALVYFVFIRQLDTVMAYVYALYAGYSLHFLVSFTLVLTYWRKQFRTLGSKESTFMTGFMSLIRYGFLNQLDVIAQMLSFRLSYYFISYYLSKGAVGIYSNAISIIESIWLISRSIAMVQNARIVNSNNTAYSVGITLKLLKISFTLVLFALILLLLIPAGFYIFIFGEEFGAIRTVIFSIAPGVLLFSASFILSGLFAGTGKYMFNTVASIAGLAVTVILAFLLIPPWGLVGAGITASASYFVSVGIKLYLLFTRYPAKVGDLKIRKEEFKEFFSLLSGTGRKEDAQA